MKKNFDAPYLIEELLTYANIHLGLRSEDENYTRNQLLALLKIDVPSDKKPSEVSIAQMLTPDRILKDIVEYAISQDIIEDIYKELFDTSIMGLVTPMPSVVIDKFVEFLQNSDHEKACNYLYDLSIKNNYIRLTDVQKNIKWMSSSKKANLEITINLSKPEKDNKEIERLKSLPQSGYPKCVLCPENEGYHGRLNHPARQNLRTIPLTLDGEKWHMQYSPYVYYDEHCIVFSDNHTPMVLNHSTFRKLADFVDIFPHYFLGSNACLPIVGGSILTHEHYQGGRHLMPMHNAKIAQTFKSNSFPGVEFSILDWYNSVIHIETTDKNSICAVGSMILDRWGEYSDLENQIIARTKNIPHNAITPIMRKDGDKYILDMILRNNKTTSEYPDGIFHAHKEYHNIKKEGIGIIEVMGLFILPARLKNEIEGIKEYISGKKKFTPKVTQDDSHPLKHHFQLIKDIIKKYSNELSDDDANIVVKEFIDEICEKILECTAVFKETDEGREGFIRFLNTCDIK